RDVSGAARTGPGKAPSLQAGCPPQAVRAVRQASPGRTRTPPADVEEAGEPVSGKARAPHASDAGDQRTPRRPARLPAPCSEQSEQAESGRARAAARMRSLQEPILRH